MRRSRQAAAAAAIALWTGGAGAQQREADAYTRYELLAPDSHKFRIVYEITAATPGATAYYNPIRLGSIASDEKVNARASGKPLPFREVDGKTAAAGGVRGATPDSRYIEVRLPRPVPADGGEGRILIDKTYEDAKSYYRDGETIVFDRSLGIKRNAIVLPKGYELISVNTPAQVLQEADGRIKIAFWNDSAAAAPLIVKARPAPGLGSGVSSMAAKLDERAHQNREIVYYLNPPESHSFSLTHDYTETRPGIATYVNVVRAGSKVATPSARNLDTGEALPSELITGEAVRRAEPEMRDLDQNSSAVVFHFAAVKPGESLRLRIAETYTDPDRYGLSGTELVWHRSFGRPANAVVLPAGWSLTNSSVPATLSTTDDGRIRLDFINPRLDEIDTIITARRRAG